jgi:hypothetical protein
MEGRMLTREEREFYDVWFMEDCEHTATYATPLAHSRGIDYNHFARMWPFYHETWKELGMESWDGWAPPLPDNPEPPCPWPTREAMEARLDELETGPHSHLTYREMREYMLQDPRAHLTAVMDESDTSGRLEPDTVPAAVSDFRASHPSR